MVDFLSPPLDLKIGDIVIERPVDMKVHPPVYWVIYKAVEVSYSTYEGYYAFDLQDSENVIGPVIFEQTKNWQYEVLRYD